MYRLEKNLLKVSTLTLALVMILGGILDVCAVPTSTKDIDQSINYQYSDTNKQSRGADFSEGMELIADCDKSQLYFDSETTRFAVKANGKIWYSFLDEEIIESDDLTSGTWKRAMQSDLLVTACDVSGDNSKEYASYRDSVQDGLFQVRYVSQQGKQIGVQIDFTFTSISTVVPMQILLQNNKLMVSVLTDQIKTEDDEYLITDISILPFFGSADIKENGYFLVPDGCGGIITFNNGATASGKYETKVYGENLTFAQEYKGAELETTRLPVWGINKGADSLFAVITSGDAYASLIAEVSGIDTEQNFIFSRFKLRQTDGFSMKDLGGKSQIFTVIDKEPTDFGDLSIEYSFLSGEDADYSGMAKYYQTILFSGRPVNRSRSGVLLDFYGVVKKKQSVLGIPMKIQQKLTGFSEVSAIVDDLEQEGVSDITLRYQYAVKGTIQNQSQDKLNISGKIGGLKQYQILTQKIENNNCYLSVGNTTSRGSLFNFGVDYVQNVMNLPAYQYKYNCLTSYKDQDSSRYYLLTKNSVKKQYERLFQDALKKEIYSLCIDDLGDLLYSGYGGNHFTREDAKQTWSDLLKAADEAGLNLMVEGANAYALPYTSVVVNAPVKSNGLAMIDYDVPFYQMVLGDYVNSAAYSINLCSNAKRQFLKCFETGSAPQFSLIYEKASLLQGTELQSLFGVDCQKWKNDIVKMAKEYQQLIEVAEDTAVIKHRVLQNGVVESIYANGVKVQINYNQSEATVEDNQIAAMSYRIVQREA